MLLNDQAWVLNCEISDRAFPFWHSISGIFLHTRAWSSQHNVYATWKTASYFFTDLKKDCPAGHKHRNINQPPSSNPNDTLARALYTYCKNIYSLYYGRIEINLKTRDVFFDEKKTNRRYVDAWNEVRGSSYSVNCGCMCIFKHSTRLKKIKNSRFKKKFVRQTKHIVWKYTPTLQLTL
jgi:hypothetical protein